MGGAGTLEGGGNGTSAIVFTYSAIGPHTIRLTKTGLNGTTTVFDEATVTVPGA
jgi:PKD repeat protein